MTTYTIQINEYQRALLVKKLFHPDIILDHNKGSGDAAFDSELEEFKVLLGMFTELPKIEAEHPNVLHGFCL